MKTILIYSGKGGVGKTTVSVLLALELQKKYKTLLVDADFNTPSLPVLFPKEKHSENLVICSLGYSKGTLFIDTAGMHQFIKHIRNTRNKHDSEYVIVDMAPSITPSHISIIKALKPSGVIFVTTPTRLSRTDLGRTRIFFDMYHVPIIGTITNMGTDKRSMFSIPRNNIFSENRLLTCDTSFVQPVLKKLDKLDETVMEERVNEIKFSTITEKELEESAQHTGFNPKFYNVATWDWVRGYLEQEQFKIFPPMQIDEFLREVTSERIGRMIDHFRDSDIARFMVSQPPCTEVRLYPGEIGLAMLDLEVTNMHYGVPRIKYKTKGRPVTLFPHEVTPMNEDDYRMYLEKEDYVNIGDDRWVPCRESLVQIENAYGSRITVPGWKESYDNLMSSTT